MEGSATIISVKKCTGREFPVTIVRVDCAGQSFQGGIFLNITSSMILSHEHVFDVSNVDTCLYGGGFCDEEHINPRFDVILVVQVTFSDVFSEGLIKDGFRVVTVFNNVSGDEKKLKLSSSILSPMLWYGIKTKVA